MAKFDIGDDDGSAMWSAVLNAEEDVEASGEPTHTQARLRTDSTRMRGACMPLGTTGRGICSPGPLTCMLACFLGVMKIAAADPATSTVPDAPERSGLYVWLGPTGAASHIDGAWDSTIGGHLAVVRIRERAPLGVIGVMAGGSLWTERGGGRIWFDGVAGTRLGRMVGVSAGPIVELSELAHPRLGASIGLWGFVGLTPFVRVGVVEQLGGFAEIGVHFALPVFRSRSPASVGSLHLGR